MNNKKIKKESCSFLFKIISECNDSCSFCLEHESIKLKRPKMTFSDFKNNLDYLKKIYKPNYIILSGGEPTLHPDFFKMLKFLKTKNEGFRFITNLINLSDVRYVKKIKNIFSDFKSEKQKKISKIIASINDSPIKDKIARKRYVGLKNLLKLKLPLVVVITIYNGNWNTLPEVSMEIRRLVEKYGGEKKFNIEFRMIYHIKTMKALLEKSLPDKTNDIGKLLEKCVEIFDIPSINMTLWNFPLCYLKNYEKIENSGIPERKRRKIIRINIDEKFEKHNVEDWIDYFKKYKECESCVMNDYCTGVDEGYINSNYYKKIKAIE